MSDPAAERAFQDEIIAHLTANGWLLGVSSDYDRERALYPEDVVGYFKDTQPEAWKRICTNHPQDPEAALLRKVTEQLEKVDPNASTAEMRKYGNSACCGIRSRTVAFLSSFASLNRTMA